MTSPPKKGAPKAPQPFARKLLTAWRNAAEKAASNRYANLSKITSEPGVWEALAASIDAGDVPIATLWRLGDDALDHVPARYAVDLLRALPTTLNDLWAAYGSAQVVLLTRLLEDPTAFDGVYAESADVARDLLDVVLIQAGVAPPASASERIRDSIARWSELSAVHTVAQVVDGRAVRVASQRADVPADVSALRSLGAQLLGDERFVATLADGHRARVQRVDASAYERVNPIYPNDIALLLASEAMTPEEVCSFQLTYVLLRAVSEKWSLDALIDAALATRERARPNGYMVAGSAALLAVSRDPTCAPRVERAIQFLEIGNTATASIATTYETFARTPAAWRIPYVTEVLFGPDEQSPGTFEGPLGVLLLLPEAAERAESLASKHADAIDFTRLIGVDPLALLALCEGAGPALRKGLALPIACGLIHTSDKPEAADALVSFDGTYRDSWLIGYVFTIPAPRALAILRREVTLGRGDLARAVVGDRRPDLLAAFDD